MADLFVSYARADKARVAPIVAALESQGWSVWWDPEITPGQEFDRLIAEELRRARAVVVVWTPASVASRWVRGEAREAADRGLLAPVRFDAADLPIDLRAIHTTDLDGWDGDARGPAFGGLTRAVRALLGEADHAADAKAAPQTRKLSICVLPFANISGDPEQEYFSDGISEDIITDLSKVASLYVTARNTAFTFKGKSVDVPQIARQLNVSHVVEGSVRKAGQRVRITAQLIDGQAGGHIWADRWDRDLDDIFALQDEISQAIVAALKLKLLPHEKTATERRGTTNAEAYDLFLLGRNYDEVGNAGDPRREESIIRLARRATEIDPNYARAWAMLARAQFGLAVNRGRGGDIGGDAARRALELDPDLAEAHAARAMQLFQEGETDQAIAEAELAVRLNPDSTEANNTAGTLAYQTQDFENAARHFRKAGEASEVDFGSSGMVMSACAALGDDDGKRAAAHITLDRAMKVLAQDRGNGHAMAFAAQALAVLGERDRAKESMARALVIDPDNMLMRYNFACTLCMAFADVDGALELLGPVLAADGGRLVRASPADPDLAALHDDPRFKALIAEAEQRVAEAETPSGG